MTYGCDSELSDVVCGTVGSFEVVEVSLCGITVLKCTWGIGLLMALDELAFAETWPVYVSMEPDDDDDEARFCKLALSNSLAISNTLIDYSVNLKVYAVYSTNQSTVVC